MTQTKFVLIDRNPSFSFHFHTFHEGIKIGSTSSWFLFPDQDHAKLNTLLVAQKTAILRSQNGPESVHLYSHFFQLKCTMNSFRLFCNSDARFIIFAFWFLLSSSSTKSMSETNRDFFIDESAFISKKYLPIYG